MVTIGKDNCALFPTKLQVANGVCLSKSNITGKYISSSRACSSDESTMNANKAVISHNASFEATNDKNFLKEITSDSIDISLVKRCIKCVGCKSCKKIHLPDQERQLARAEIVQKSLSFDGAGHTASYPYK